VSLQQPDQFRAAFVSLALERIAALVVGPDPFFNMQRDQLVSLAEKTACRPLEVGSGWKGDLGRPNSDRRLRAVSGHTRRAGVTIEEASC
jgi:hypothetical protein